MDDLQRINKYDSILDFIFDMNSYEMDEKNAKYFGNTIPRFYYQRKCRRVC